MAKNEQRFRCAGFLDGCVPHHHALGWAKAGYISVKRRDFFAGLHQKHAVAGNIESPTLCDLLNGIHQLRIALVQRLEFVERRMDDDGRTKNKKNDKWYSNEPAPKPPPARALTNQSSQDP